jgi:ABC-type glycerol-3-phosphate transport system substrate-binding protein
MRSSATRRTVLKNATLAFAAGITAPYVRGAYAAGKLTLGCWDHWVPGANSALTKICNEWGEKNKVEVHIDYITSQGEKDKLTAAAEAQAGTGHDIMSHRDWNVQIHQRMLEPPAGGSQVKPCQSRFDLYQEHCGIDLRAMFPADESKYDKAKIDTWTWDVYLDSAQKLHKAGFPVGLPMGQTSDAVDWVGALFMSFGAVLIDEKDNIKVNSDETRTVLEYLKKLMAVNPPEVYAWDDAGNNRWIISGKGSGIMNPPSSWAVAKRDNPTVAEKLWTHAMPRGPKGRFVGQLPQFYGLWAFSKNKPAAKDLLLHMSQRESMQELVEASIGYDLPSFKSMYDFPTWKVVGPPVGTVYSYPPRGDEQTSIAAAPARAEVGAQIYNQAINTVMVSKFTQGNEKLDDVIKWAERELEGTLRV